MKDADVSSNTSSLLQAQGLARHFRARGGSLFGAHASVKAVDGVDLDLRRGETLGIVGESGCGKSSLGRLLTGLDRPDSGTVTIEGQDIQKPSVHCAIRRRLQIIFQDPYSSLNPRMTVYESIAEPLIFHGLASKDQVPERVLGLLGEVGLPAAFAERYPHALSGGQRQRVGIARALACEPDIIVCDEAVSALDVSVKAQVINLLVGLQSRRRISYVFISHDLSVVRHVADRIAIMYLGKIVEEGPTIEVFVRPRHPYTQALLSAIPGLFAEDRGRRILLEGDPPDPSHVPSGCRFRTRCRYAQGACASTIPTFTMVGDDHRTACLRIDDIPPIDRTNGAISAARAGMQARIALYRRAQSEAIGDEGV